MGFSELLPHALTVGFSSIPTTYIPAQLMVLSLKPDLQTTIALNPAMAT